MRPYARMRDGGKWDTLREEMQRWYLHSVGHTLAGGTSEMIRNTIATIGLGLPRQ